MAIFKGAAVAIITPMKANGDVNFEAFNKIIDDQIANGTDAIVVCGSTGEGSTLTEEEHIEVIRYVTEYTKKRVPVIAGTGSNCTRTAIKLSKSAQSCGVDGLLLVSPYYNKGTQNGIYTHFTEVAKNVDLPILLYNIPGRTGVNIKAETCAKLFKDVDNIVGIKEATGDTVQIAELMNLTDGQIDLYAGNDDYIVPVLSLGGIGVISVLSHVAPRDTHDMVMKFLEGDVKTSRDLQIRYLPLIESLFCEVNPIPVKAAMNILGYEAGTLRLPLTDIEPAHAELIRNEMKKMGIL